MTKERKERKLITVKIVNFFAGLLILGASIWILLDSGVAVDFFIVMIASALNIIGFVRIFNGLYRDDLKKSVKTSKTITGIISLLLGTTIIVIDFRFSSISIAWLILLVSITLLLNAISRFFTGIQAKRYPLWYRILTIVAGFASLVVAVLIGLTNLNIVVIIPSQETQVILLAYTLILLALVRISLVFLKKPE